MILEDIAWLMVLTISVLLLMLVGPHMDILVLPSVSLIFEYLYLQLLTLISTVLFLEYVCRTINH